EEIATQQQKPGIWTAFHWHIKSYPRGVLRSKGAAFALDRLRQGSGPVSGTGTLLGGDPRITRQAPIGAREVEPGLQGQEGQYLHLVAVVVAEHVQRSLSSFSSASSAARALRTRGET